MPPTPNQHLARLRRYRATPRGPDLALDAPLRELTARVAAEGRTTDAFADAWARTAPPSLATRVRTHGVARGALRLTAADAAARFEADRWLRAGGAQALSRAARRVIQRWTFV